MAGIPIITGFDLAAGAAIDSRYVMPDAATRDAIVWKYPGLLIYQVDVNSYFYWDGAAWQPVAFGGTPGADGSVWHNGLGAPAGALGAVGDYYLETITGDVYNKTGPTTWAIVANIQGPQGDSGAEPAFGSLYVYQAASGQSITTTPVLITQFPNTGPSNGGVHPSGGSSQIVVDNPGDYVLFLNANVIGDGGSLVSYDVGIFVNGVASLAAITFEVNGTVSEMVVLQTVVNLPASAVLTLHAKHYSTGSIGLTFVTGTWGVFGVNAKGDRGKALIHTEHDIVLDETKITSVTGGTWTAEDPYSASILVDNRANLSAPAGLSGNKVGHSISYNGTDWFDNGIWRGPQGAPGTPGTPGASGINATGGTKIRTQGFSFNSEVLGLKNVPGYLGFYAKAYSGWSFSTPLESTWKPMVQMICQIRGHNNPARVRFHVQRSGDAGTTWDTILGSQGTYDYEVGSSYHTTVIVNVVDFTAVANTGYMYRLLGYNNNSTQDNYFSSGFGCTITLVPA